MAEPSQPSETSPTPQPAEGTGLEPNVAGALAYFLGALTGVLFLILDKDRPFVRFHAMQSILFSLAWFGLWIGLLVLDVVLGAVPVVGWLLSLLLNLILALVGFILWLLFMYRAFQGEEWEFPFIGEHARRMARKAAGAG